MYPSASLPSDQQFITIQELKEKGFSETASLKGEAEDGGDVVIYDRRISPC